ncbi:MAG: 2-amino-4-hydroxy-6-hydroxymethyldihydropteridine diphosphokinase [Dysgonomonas sp.]|nr:2-amino-4-hydroxy-6-hydroxymethyldihydropteridine diphosphokinase [Dysgonomonas sp.]
MLSEKREWHDVYLGLGSNLGDRGENLHHALDNIEERIGKIFATSAFYMTDPVGFQSPNQFLNAVCGVRTHLLPLEILSISKSIEKDMGRATKSTDGHYSDRIIDIDLLLFDDLIYKDTELILPHPHLHERSFVLLPLSEIAGEYIHPVLKKSINELKEEL